MRVYLTNGGQSFYCFQEFPTASDSSFAASPALGPHWPASSCTSYQTRLGLRPRNDRPRKARLIRQTMTATQTLPGCCLGLPEMRGPLKCHVPGEAARVLGVRVCPPHFMICFSDFECVQGTAVHGSHYF